MIDFPFMLWVKLPVVDRIHPQSKTFVMGVKNQAPGDLKLNDSPAYNQLDPTNIPNQNQLLFSPFQLRTQIYLLPTSKC